MLLSIILPVYNEIYTLEPLLALIAKVELPAAIEREIIIIDDCSDDGTREFLATVGQGAKILHNDTNRGKGYSVRRGLAAAQGDIAIIQDGDLEYNPADYIRLLEPILRGDADAVYGSRFLPPHDQKWLNWLHKSGNRLLTVLSNVCSGLRLTDLETCYKMLTRPVIDAILPHLTSNRYAIEPEITALIARIGFRIIETGVSYNSRSYQRGKKIKIRDGLAAVAAIVYFNLIAPHRH